VKGGPGGAGCMSFRREAHVPKGGPDGGDGGEGGDVVLAVDRGVSTLAFYHRKHHFKAERGEHGMGSKRHGAAGEDLVLTVPPGTVVIDHESGEPIADLVAEGDRVTVARGGRGGRGNPHFTTPTRRAPAFAELGEPPEERWIRLELKLLADAALVGLPNVGKSSLIARLSAARPKIADYEFTTLTPNLGVVAIDEYSYVVADVPGLIEGASEGHGLGHGFLRHIERTALILHVVDLSGGWAGRDPVEDVAIIEQELAAHAPELARRPVILVGNKSDLPDTGEASARLQALARERDLPYVAVSAATGEGVDRLARMAGDRVSKLRASAETDEGRTVDAVYRSEPDERGFEVLPLADGTYRVRGRGVERMVVMTDMENEEAVAYLQTRLAGAGVERALAEAGAREGDTVRIAGMEFEFEPSEEARR
ncbi:MAG: GTPase ObgE, partial [Actinomycetota bacterium]